MRPSEWLIGTWRSDKERTVAGWGKYPPGSPGFRKILLRDLGKLMFRYTAKRSTSVFEGVSATSPYCVLWQSQQCAFLVSGQKGSEEGQLLNFETPSVYWVHVGKFVEYFSRVEEPNNAFNGRRAKRARR